jgi:hypothetical protein
MNKSDLEQTRAAAKAHALWLKKNLPRVYNGLVENLVVARRANQQALGFILSDGFDISSLVESVPDAIDVVTPAIDYASAESGSSGGFFSGLVDSFTNLLSSGGVTTLVNAAQPFINNAVQRQAIDTQLTQLRYGLPVTIAGTTTPMPVQPLRVTAAGAVSQLTNYMPFILIGGGALLLLSILNRPNTRR